MTQGFTKATTVEFVEGSHDPMYTHENSCGASLRISWCRPPMPRTILTIVISIRDSVQ